MNELAESDKVSEAVGRLEAALARHTREGLQFVPLNPADLHTVLDAISGQSDVVPLARGLVKAMWNDRDTPEVSRAWDELRKAL